MTNIEPIKAFILRGPFTQEDFALLVRALRQIDDRHPDKSYELVAVDAGQSALDRAEEMLRESIPPTPDRVTEVHTLKRNKVTGISPTIDDLMDGLGWSEEYRRGVQAAWPEIDRLRAVLRMICDLPNPDQHRLATTMQSLAKEGLRGE